MTTAQITSRPLTRPVAAAPVIGRDPLGLKAGWRGYVVWRDLSALSDAELASRGLTRADIPAMALKAIRDRG